MDIATPSAATPRALKDYATAIDNDENARAISSGAQLHLDCNDFVAAEIDVSEVIAREPENPEGYYTRGTVRQQNGDAIGGEEDFSTALKLKPDHAFALLGRAICHQMRKNFAAVVTDCDRLIQLMPGLVKAFELQERRENRWGISRALWPTSTKR